MFSAPSDVEFDEYCDPNNPRTIAYVDILAASRKIVGGVIKTPCMKAHMSEILGMEIYMKQEFLQYTGSFKDRGVRNGLLSLSDDRKKCGVISASCGNHGYAMAYHASLLNIPCVIVMPKFTPVGKILKCEQYGARVLVQGNCIYEAKRHAMTVGKEKRMTFIDGTDHPNVIEGAGSIGIEIIEQVPTVDAILVPVGGGALLTGVAIAAKHLKPDTQIYGIETDKTCTLVETLRKNERIFLPIENTIADSLAVNMIGVNTFNNIKGNIVDKMVVVKEEWVARALLHLAEDEKFVVEGGGAVGLAAIMAGLFPNLKGKKVVVIMTGGNMEATFFSRAMERGLAEESRLLKFKVTVDDHPGGRAELCALLFDIGVALRDCLPERAWIDSDVYCVDLVIIAETKGLHHTKELIQQIKKHYTRYQFPALSEDKPASSRRGPCLAPNPVCMQK